MAGQPVDTIKWVHRSTLKANDYNPNAMAKPELDLLKISILEDGWTQPIVALQDGTIVDGFHRWTVSAEKELLSITGGMIPVVYIRPKNRYSQKISTIRHNRASGTHAVLKMADIVQDMVAQGVSMQEMCYRMGMEEEEIIRLCSRKGIPRTAIIQNSAWSASWKPE